MTAHCAIPSSSLDIAYGAGTLKKVRSTRVLVVGAGGVGCELVKNLAISGFINIIIIDLDVIDVSNLNRQFLFRRHHVSQPKAAVAANSIKDLVAENDKNMNIEGITADIKEDRFDVAWFGSFDLVCNALDNIEARRHVNRMCLAADVVMIESGSTGYNGQVAVVKSPQTECYDCTPKPVQKSYAVCTIRSTPEKPVHCVVWAKALFDLIFGPPDDSNVLADLHFVSKAEDIVDLEQIAFAGMRNGNDKEKMGDKKGKSDSMTNGIALETDESANLNEVETKSSHGPNVLSKTGKSHQKDGIIMSTGTSSIPNGGTEKTSASSASGIRYHADDTPESFANRICQIIFHDDIEYQHGLDALWSDERPAPSTIDINMDKTKIVNIDSLDLQSDKPWELRKSCSVFLSSLVSLATSLAGEKPYYQSFDKDNAKALAFVVSAANIRASAYHIKDGCLSPFKGKGIAGNIIHAVATTNAVVAGLVVLEALRIVSSDFDVEKAGSMTAFVVRKPSGGGSGGKGKKRRRSFIVNGEPIRRGRADCFVCGGGAKGKGWRWRGDIGKWRLEEFLERVVRKEMGIGMPMIDNLGVGEDGGVLIYECGDDLDEYETEMYKANEKKTLEELGVKKIGGALSLSDLASSRQAVLYVQQSVDVKDDASGDLGFELVGSWPKVAPPSSSPENKTKVDLPADSTAQRNSVMDTVDVDELEIVEDGDTNVRQAVAGVKRSLDEIARGAGYVNESERAAKRTRDISHS